MILQRHHFFIFYHSNYRINRFLKLFKIKPILDIYQDILPLQIFLSYSYSQIIFGYDMCKYKQYLTFVIIFLKEIFSIRDTTSTA